MSKVQVMTDTVSGISSELARKYSIIVVPAVNIVFDGHFYLDSVDISAAEAYQLLQKDPDKFSASTLTPADFLDYFRNAGKEAESIVHITFSSTFSGTYKIASLAAELLHKESPQIRIKVIDSKTAAASQGLLAVAAAEAARIGLDFDQVVNVVEKLRKKTGGVMMLDTLRYVYRTGRMSKTASRIASLFNIKPINRMTEEGTLELVDRVRKREDGYQKLIELIKKEAGTESLHFMISHANAPELGEQMSELIKQNFNCSTLEITEYSPIMGYAAGPGCLFIGFRPEVDLSKL